MDDNPASAPRQMKHRLCSPDAWLSSSLSRSCQSLQDQSGLHDATIGVLSCENALRSQKPEDSSSGLSYSGSLAGYGILKGDPNPVTCLSHYIMTDHGHR